MENKNEKKEISEKGNLTDVILYNVSYVIINFAVWLVMAAFTPFFYIIIELISDSYEMLEIFSWFLILIRLLLIAVAGWYLGGKYKNLESFQMLLFPTIVNFLLIAFSFALNISDFLIFIILNFIFYVIGIFWGSKKKEKD